MNHKTLTEALPIVAAAYGRKFNVAVEVGGDHACTDGTIIRIPQVAEDPTARTLAWGYLAHEAGHVRHTDFSVWNTVAGHPLTRAITNILEDVRIENAMIGSYPGVRQTLDAVLDWMIAEGKIAAPSMESSPPTILVNALLVLARHRYRRQATLASLARASEHALRQVFPPSFVHRLVGLTTEIPTLKSTEESADLARRIVALIQEESEKQQPNSQPQDQAEKDDQRGEHASEPNQDKRSTEAGGGASGLDQDDGPKDQGDGATGSDMDAGTDNRAPCSGTEALREVLSAEADGLPKDLFETVAEALGGEGHGRSVTTLPSLEQYAGNRQQGSARLAQAKGHSAKLTTRLQGLVQAHTLTRQRTVRQGRTLSPQHLHRAAVGDPRIFTVSDRKAAPNTALHLLVDLSGSMAGGSDGIALAAAMALALALEPIPGVSRAVTAFPSLNALDTEVTRILSHGDRVSARAGAFVQYARGSTPMTGALWYATADLLSRREQRKVVLVLTDGSPDDWESAAEVIGKAGTAGIEMVGIGIQHDVSRLFPVAIRIDEIADLKRELFRVAERLLLTTRHASTGAQAGA